MVRVGGQPKPGDAVGGGRGSKTADPEAVFGGGRYPGERLLRPWHRYGKDGPGGGGDVHGFGQDGGVAADLDGQLRC